MPYTCPVCSYPKLKEAPRSKSGGGSYEICPSCGYQFGVDDDDRRITHEQWRAAWLKGGAAWSSQGLKPPRGWSGKAQLSGATGASAAPKKKAGKKKSAVSRKSPAGKKSK